MGSSPFFHRLFPSPSAAAPSARPGTDRSVPVSFFPFDRRPFRFTVLMAEAPAARPIRLGILVSQFRLSIAVHRLYRQNLGFSFEFPIPVPSRHCRLLSRPAHSSISPTCNRTASSAPVFLTHDLSRVRPGQTFGKQPGTYFGFSSSIYAKMCVA